MRLAETSDVKKVFGTSVKAWRGRLGISQEELAERADLHRTYISDVERGARNLSLASISKLAQALDISVATLFPAELSGQKTGVGRRHKSASEPVDILLVEDNADDVALTLRAFKQAHFTNRVQVVTDGLAALDYLFCRGKYVDCQSAKRPQVILLDLNLPKLSGMDVMRRIKADKRTANIPVIILTMSDDHYDMAKCRRLGAENYIVKPVSFQEFSRVTPRLNLEWMLLKPPGPSRRSRGNK
jgi:CheY-like chemotaxis protein